MLVSLSSKRHSVGRCVALLANSRIFSIQIFGRNFQTLSKVESLCSLNHGSTSISICLPV